MTTDDPSMAHSTPSMTERVDEPPEYTDAPNVEIIDWNGLDDPQNPFNWPKPRKLVITVLCLLGTLSCNANSTALTVAWRQTNPIYGISDDTFPNSYWAVTSWTLGGCFFMAFLLPLTEAYSIRWGYLISYSLFIVFNIPQAVTTNYGGFLSLRFLAGGCSSMVANLVAGISCDIWGGERSRNVPIASFITVYLVGSAIGPVVGAAVLSSLDWTWIIWVQVIWNAALLLAIALVLKESRGDIILRQKARNIRRTTRRAVCTASDMNSNTMWDDFVIAIKRPVWMLCTEYVIFTFSIWSAFAVGLVFLFTQSTEIVFAETYGWTTLQAGYVQAATAIGMVLAWFANFLAKYLYFASIPRNKERPGEPIPEAHLYVSIGGSLIGISGGMFVYGWTAYSHIHWMAPAVGLAMVGFGINTVVCALGAYLTACYSFYAVSACGIVGVAENLTAAFLPLATMAMYRQLGVHWPSSILGILAIAVALAPLSLIVWGPAIRARSPFIQQARYETEKSAEKTTFDSQGVLRVESEA